MKHLSDRDKSKLIEELDLEVWSTFAMQVKPGTRPGIVYHCYCPHCQADQKKIEKTTHNVTAFVYRHHKGWGAQGDGLGFFCAACGTKHPRVYEFLGGEGSIAAEEYAWKRFEADCVGKGWYCPYPKRWKELSEQAVKARAAKYRAEYEQRKQTNRERCSSASQPPHPRKPRRSDEEREELKKQAREVRRGLMISPRESGNPLSIKDPASKETGK